MIGIRAGTVASRDLFSATRTELAAAAAVLMLALREVRIMHSTVFPFGLGIRKAPIWTIRGMITVSTGLEIPFRREIPLFRPQPFATSRPTGTPKRALSSTPVRKIPDRLALASVLTGGAAPLARRI